MKTAAILVVALLVSAPAFAQIYKWVDAEGKVHYDSRPPANVKAEPITDGKVSTVAPQKPVQAGPAAASAPTRAKPASATQPRVVMYATSWCGYCAQARQWFSANRIAFTEYDVEANANAMAEFRKLGGRGYPLIMVGDERVAGFSQRRLAQLLGVRQ